MGSEEKLQQFYEDTIQTIDARAKEELSAYEASLAPQLDEYKKSAQAANMYAERLESENLKKAARQELSREVINLKHILAQKEADYTEQIFSRVLELISSFRKTAGYKKLIRKYIYEAIEFAKDDELIIYLDLDDGALEGEFEAEFGREIRVSRYSFGGGLRALIPARNILIENSFSSKLLDQMQSFDINSHINLRS